MKPAPNVRQHQPAPGAEYRAGVRRGRLRRLAASCHLPGLLHLPHPCERLRQVSGQHRSRVSPAARHHLRHGGAPTALRQVRRPGGQGVSRQPGPGLAAVRHPGMGTGIVRLNSRYKRQSATRIGEQSGRWGASRPFRVRQLVGAGSVRAAPVLRSNQDANDPGTPCFDVPLIH